MSATIPFFQSVVMYKMLLSLKEEVLLKLEERVFLCSSSGQVVMTPTLCQVISFS